MKRKVNFGTGLVGLCTALLWVNSASCQAQSAPTVEDFDGVHTHYNIYQLNPASTAPTIIPNGMSGNCLRLATDSTVTSDNTITFDRTAGGVFSQIVAEFDFRITLGNNGRADGLGFALAHLNNKGPDGKVVLNLPEQPDLADSLGVGFDIYDDAHPNPNYVSVHFNQANIVQRDAGFDLASGQFIHARIVMQPGGNSSNVSVFLTPPGGTEVSIINQYPVPGFTSYPNCGVFGARCGGQSANFDLDNINVSYVSPPAAPVSGFFQFVKTPGDRFIGYAPYRTTPTTASITADLQLLSRYFNGLILYGTDMTDLGGNHPMSAWIMSEAKRLGFGAVI
ncbi:MAG: hypothetical protein JOZ57_08670, partial [Abitibacteriaceae bacterium]|nr:hypothetical protein [Abditibacteriaceae bacterium]